MPTETKVRMNCPINIHDPEPGAGEDDYVQCPFGLWYVKDAEGKGAEAGHFEMLAHLRVEHGLSEQDAEFNIASRAGGVHAQNVIDPEVAEELKAMLTEAVQDIEDAQPEIEQEAQEPAPPTPPRHAAPGPGVRYPGANTYPGFNVEGEPMRHMLVLDLGDMPESAANYIAGITKWVIASRVPEDYQPRQVATITGPDAEKTAAWLRMTFVEPPQDLSDYVTAIDLALESNGVSQAARDGLGKILQSLVEMGWRVPGDE